METEKKCTKTSIVNEVERAIEALNRQAYTKKVRKDLLKLQLIREVLLTGTQK
jgi:hypothetical protein